MNILQILTEHRFLFYGSIFESDEVHLQYVLVLEFYHVLELLCHGQLVLPLWESHKVLGHRFHLYQTDLIHQ